MRADAAAVPETVEVPGAERERIRRGLRYCAGVFLGVRLGLGVLAVLGTALLPALDSVSVPGWPAPPDAPGVDNVFTSWERFDALWFLRVADAGYRLADGSGAFFPLYPLLIRGFSALLGGSPLAAALLVSNAAFLGALVVFYFLSASEWNERIARRSVLLLALFPTAFFFLAPYSEAPFLLFALLALWGARRGRWEIAGSAGALATATRSIGIVLVPALLAEAIHQWRERREDLAWPVLWSLAAGLGLLSYLAFWKVWTGDWLGPLHIQANNWQREFSLPWATLWAGTREAFRWIGQSPGGYHLLDWLVVVPALVAGGWVALRARPAYALYAWGSLLIPLSYIFAPRPFMSLPRFLLVAFPLIWAPAALAARRPGAQQALVTVFAAGLGILTVLFVNWYFIF